MTVFFRQYCQYS